MGTIPDAVGAHKYPARGEDAGTVQERRIKEFRDNSLRTAPCLLLRLFNLRQGIPAQWQIVF